MDKYLILSNLKMSNLKNIILLKYDDNLKVNVDLRLPVLVMGGSVPQPPFISSFSFLLDFYVGIWAKLR